MKASVLIAAYNKDRYLPNVLESLKRQKTNFPLEVCVLDDCSPNDPTKIVERHLPEAKFVRLNKNVGGRCGEMTCYDLLASDDSDIIILMSSEVIYLQTFAIQELCDNLSQGFFTLAEVKNIAIEPDFWVDFDKNARVFVSNWDILKAKRYSGSKRKDGRFFFFMGAMYRTDLDRLRFGQYKCDKMLDLRIRDDGRLKPKYLDNIFGIHQSHPSKLHYCALVDECPYARRVMSGKICQQRKQLSVK